MQIAILGLGRMGAGLAERLLEAGHEITVWNRHAEKAAPLVAKGAHQIMDFNGLKDMPTPRHVWVMLPAGDVTEQTIFGEAGLASVLDKDDVIIDGGNSHYTDTKDRAERLKAIGIKMLDIGTSGGLGGRDNGYCLMIGGDKEAAENIKPILETIAQKDGYLWCGPNGAGHYVKMVHNGVEYGMMQSIAEGFGLLKNSEYAELDLGAIADVWQHGSIVQSYLVGLAKNIFTDNPKLDGIPGYVAENGEARWTLEAAKERNVPMPSIELALDVRARSNTGEINDTTKILAALRQQFGGHSLEKPE